MVPAAAGDDGAEEQSPAASSIRSTGAAPAEEGKAVDDLGLPPLSPVLPGSISPSLATPGPVLPPSQLPAQADGSLDEVPAKRLQPASDEYEYCELASASYDRLCAIADDLSQYGDGNSFVDEVENEDNVANVAPGASADGDDDNDAPAWHIG